MHPSQTSTTVHSVSSQRQQRWESYIRDQYKLSALSLAIQLWTGYCMYLMDHVSTPSYLAILMLFLPMFILYFLFSCFSRHVAQENNSLLTVLLPKFLGRLIEIWIALSLLLDATLILYHAVSLVGEILPNLRRWIIAPLYAFICLGAVWHNRPFALSRLAGWLFFPLLLLVALSTFPVLNQGSINHFFPVLGTGWPSIFQGSLWMTGCLCPVCLPLLMPDNKDAIHRMRQHKKHRSALYFLLAAVFALLLSAIYTYLMPPYALSRPLSTGSRLLLPTQISASIPGWTIFTCALLLLTMITYTGAVWRSGIFLCCSVSPSKRCPDWLLALLFAVTIPLPLLYSHTLQNILLHIAPFRILPYLLALLLAGCSLLIRKYRRSVPQ